jgi:hypothetical protein
MLDSWTDREKWRYLEKKTLLQCLFFHHTSHTKWRKIQQQLYSQKTAPNYPTSGFNNIHLKCAQHNCMDTLRIMYCSLILEPIQHTGKWVSTPPASLVNTCQDFKKEYQIQSTLQLQEHVSRTAIIVLCFGCE